MASEDIGDSGLFPDSVSGRRLRELLNQNKPTAPISSIIPSLEFIDESIGSGGLCDLQLVIIQIVNKSQGGLEFIQLLTGSLYLFECCYDTLVESIDSAESEYSSDDKDKVIGELKRLQRSYKKILDAFTQLHLDLSATASIERMQKLRLSQSESMEPFDAESRLLISDAVLDSLGLDRDQVNKFIRDN